MTTSGVGVEPSLHGFSMLTWRVPGLRRDRIWRLLRVASADPETGKLFVQGKAVGADPFWSRGSARFGALALAAPYFAWARDVQSRDRGLFETLVEALAPRSARSGLNAGPTEAEVFFGDYRCTPGGIHREACSNLHLVLAGEKTMHFWPEVWSPPPGAARRATRAEGTATAEEYLPGLDPADVLSHAVSMTGSAGDGFAWTAGTWHAASTRGPALALNIASYHAHLGDNRLMPLYGDEPGGAVMVHQIPADWLDDYRRFTGTPTPEAALSRLSSLAMRPAPAGARPQVSVRAGHVVRRRLDVPLFVVRDWDRLLAGVLGDVRSLSAPSVEWLCEPWRHGDTRTVPDNCCDAAAWLCGQRVLEAVEEA